MSQPITITVLTPEPKGDLAERMWREDMSWVFKEPYLVAVGRTYPEHDNDVCPVWGDRLGWKSATVIVPPELEDAASYCLACAHGGGYSRRKVLEDGRVALRSDYQAW